MRPDVREQMTSATSINGRCGDLGIRFCRNSLADPSLDHERRFAIG